MYDGVGLAKSVKNICVEVCGKIKYIPKDIKISSYGSLYTHIVNVRIEADGEISNIKITEAKWNMYESYSEHCIRQHVYEFFKELKKIYLVKGLAGLDGC